MAGWIASGRIAEFILLLTGAEILFLLVWRHPRLQAANLLANILAGDFLLMAWLTDQRHLGWPVTSGALLGALTCHLTDLYRRAKTPL